MQKKLLAIEKNLKEPTSRALHKGKRILIQDIEDSNGDEEQGRNEAEHGNGSREKSKY